MSSIFRNYHIPACAALFGAMLLGQAQAATSSPGVVTLTATLNDFAGSTSTTSGQRHDAVVWVTKADGTFIKTLWKQGPVAFDGTDWKDHFGAWNTSRGTSTAIDGFTGATAFTYVAPNNPITVTWNCKDASDNLVEDGDYKFFVQYAESKNLTVNGVSTPEQGPVANGLTWTKGPSPQSLTPPNEGTYGSPVGGFNFTNLSIVWSIATVPPTITSSAPTSTGSQGTPYSYTMTATGSDPITFSVTAGALPDGLTLSKAGVISGTPTVAGTFTGTVTASNGLTPANQPFSINIAQAIVFTSAAAPGNGNIVTPYSHTCTVIGTAPVTFSVGSGSLPLGLTLSADGVISGTPTEIGTYTGKIKAHNGLAPDSTQDFSIVIGLATDGSVTLTATLSDYTGTTSTTVPGQHDAVAWVTDASGKFIKTLWKQGPASFTHKDWTDHFVAYTTARGTSVAIDGYTSATAVDYTTTPANNPVTFTWNCRDANGNLVDDGDYKFFIQYAENQSGAQGPVTTALTWTKGIESQELDVPAQGTQGSPVLGNNFTNMTIDWDSGAVIAPEIIVQNPINANLVNGGTKDFGPLLVNTTSAISTFTLKNYGITDLTGLSISLYGVDASDFAIVSPLSVTAIAPWTATSFSIVFKPTALGVRNATVRILSNDSDDSPFDIQLTGTATPPPAPEIVVMQPVGSSLKSGLAKRNFGVVSIANPKGKTLTFTVKNIGDAPLTGLKLVKDGYDRKAFVVGDLTVTSLEPGATTTFKVTFKPSVKGTRRGGIRIRSNDEDENPFGIEFAGQGVK